MKSSRICKRRYFSHGKCSTHVNYITPLSSAPFIRQRPGRQKLVNHVSDIYCELLNAERAMALPILLIFIWWTHSMQMQPLHFAITIPLNPSSNYTHDLFNI